MRIPHNPNSKDRFDIFYWEGQKFIVKFEKDGLHYFKQFPDTHQENYLFSAYVMEIHPRVLQKQKMQGIIPFNTKTCFLIKDGRVERTLWLRQEDPTTGDIFHEYVIKDIHARRAKRKQEKRELLKFVLGFITLDIILIILALITAKTFI